MALTALQVDKHGLDEMDNKILIAIIDKYKGGPVGINTLATVVGEESGTIEEVYRTISCATGLYGKNQEEEWLPIWYRRLEQTKRFLILARNILNTTQRTKIIKEKAFDLGFSHVGISKAGFLVGKLAT